MLLIAFSKPASEARSVVPQAPARWASENEQTGERFLARVQSVWDVFQESGVQQLASTAAPDIMRTCTEGR